MLQPNSRPLLWLLAFLNAIGPLSTDLYLPAWPALQAAFDTDIGHVQLTLSAYFIGFALCQLLCGPLADRYGRRPVLLGGLAVYLAGTLACALAQTIDQLILFRLVQGIGACSGPTLARAVIRDTREGADAARAMGLMAALMTLAPLVAPLLGGVLVMRFDWRALFWLLVLLVALQGILVWRLLPETWPAAQRAQHALSPRQTLARYPLLLRDRDYRRYVLTAAFLNAGATAFVAGSSTILIDHYGVGTTRFGFYFAVIVLGFAAGSLLSARVGARIAGFGLLPFTCLLGITAAALTLTVQAGLPAQHSLAPLLYVACVGLYTAAIGLSLPQAMAGALQNFAALAGTASALWGFVLMLFAASAGALVGWGLQYTPYAIALTMMAGASTALWCCTRPTRTHATSRA